MICMHIPSRTGIFVLNLDRSADRMEWMTSQLAAFGMRHHRVAAIDGQTADLDAAMRSLGVSLGRPKGRSLVRSEIACYLSHLTAIKLAITQDYSAALILEDDVEILGDISSVLDDFVRFEHKPYILRLEPWHKPHWQVPIVDFAGIRAIYTPDPVWFCGAYCITRDAMKRVIARLTELSLPIDKELFSYHRARLTVLMSSPPLAKQANQRFASLIQSERKGVKAARQTPLKRLRQKLRRRHESLIGFGRLFTAVRLTSRQLGVSSVMKLRLRPNHTLESPK
jgi:GR25 family glycosyltransferase involved in LPS biosynthesis